MDSLNAAAVVGLVAGALYLLVALAVSGRRRREAERREAESGEAAKVVLNLAEATRLHELNTPDRMRRMAAIFASAAGHVFGEEFDFTMESIARVDRAIVAGWGKNGEPVEPGPDVILAIGAYLGEILVRRTRGRWVTGLFESDPAAVLYLASDEKETVSFSPFLLVREKFEKMYSTDLSIAFTALQQKLKELQAA